MINKPQGYDTAEAREFGEFIELPPGGYSCEIINAYQTYSKTSKKEMLVLVLDIVGGEYSGHFGGMDEKMQFQSTYYQLVESVEFFKGLIKVIENSNPGYIWDWNPKSLIGRRCCGVYGREQYVSNKDSQVKWSTRLVRITTLAKLAAGEVKPPRDKYVDGTPNNVKPPGSNNTSDYFEIDASVTDSDLPF